MKNESPEHNQIHNLWSHLNNNWIQNTCDPSNLQLEATHGFSRLGSVLADDMGLGKTISTLTLILATNSTARRFQMMNQDSKIVPTLVICPLATLTNWENKIRMHFQDQALPYQKFHGQHWQKISREDLLSSLVVLTTYDMIGATGNQLHTNNITIELLNICWYRVVLDEAHMIRNPTTNRSFYIQGLKSNLVLCLTGTPFQNQLTDVQSLVKLLNIAPWSNNWIWKGHLIPGMNVGPKDAIRTLNQSMDSVCLRRTKDVLLDLPKKIEKVKLTLSIQQPMGSKRISLTAPNDLTILTSSNLLQEGTQHFLELAMARLCKASSPSREPEGIVERRPRYQKTQSCSIFKGSSYVAYLEISQRKLSGVNMAEGSLNLFKRDENLAQFRSDQNCDILLASIEAAGVGIDFRFAQNVNLIGIQQAQAVNHLYRLGQTHEVHVYQYYVKGTLEKDVHQVQKRKGELASLGVPSHGDEDYECANWLKSDILN
ncbi:hypothetical protein PSTG_11883 [Puccinia striiformis f. sp. tritici PST-78]|uniref:Helicase ATP-binding domain-containing protein n=1 Tax=Puccinia striiformis f. sp. tritici PST-78 TaxID=1165861 RepID=A0A0L0V6H2_9BASI|nr:hypothetical protein PSTG_11883 [Puccinia striiformis f. sp. tritici PST-78]